MCKWQIKWKDKKFLSREKRKELLRTLIEKVVVDREKPDQVKTRIVWVGGENTVLVIPVTVSSIKRLSNWQELEKKVVSLSKENRSSQEIADILTEQGYRSPTQKCLLAGNL